MKENKKYWLIQFVGWSLFALLNIYIWFAGNEQLDFTVIVINILLSAGGLAITHLFRKIILRWNWFSLDTTRLITRILLITIFLDLLFCLLNYALLNIFYADQENISHITTFFRPFMAAYLILLGWTLIYFTWSFIENNRSQMIDRLEMQNELKDLEIKSIRANLKPHFIFNSLNSIRALVNEKPAAAREAVTKLSNILRSSISTQENVVPLTQEIQIVNDYLHLEKIRFEERLQYHINIDPETNDCLIPSLLIQTLVENSVKHGIATSEEGGWIKLSSQKTESAIIITIENPGQIHNPNNSEFNTGFGMKSSQKRLHYLYPQATLSISEKNNIVTVKITIPYEN